MEAQAEAPIDLGPYTVQRISTMDGWKFFFAGDNWALLRFSGTEPVLRIFAEADSESKADELIGYLKERVLG
jgi:phosphomannomutase